MVKNQIKREKKNHILSFVADIKLENSQRLRNKKFLSGDRTKRLLVKFYFPHSSDMVKFE